MLKVFLRKLYIFQANSLIDFIDSCCHLNPSENYEIVETNTFHFIRWWEKLLSKSKQT